jgi:hypothetical protein
LVKESYRPWLELNWRVVHTICDLCNVALTCELEDNGLGVAQRYARDTSVPSSFATRLASRRKFRSEKVAPLIEWLPGGLLTPSETSDVAQQQFLDDLIEARAETAGGALAGELHAQVTLKQALGRRGGDAVARAERALAAALLYHEGQLEAAMTFGIYLVKRDTSATPSSSSSPATQRRSRVPTAVDAVWRVAYNLRVW